MSDRTKASDIERSKQGIDDHSRANSQLLAAIQEGVASGDPEPWNAEEIKLAARSLVAPEPLT